MDKLDLVPPSGLPPKPVRAELSHLTNDVLAFLDGEGSLGDVHERLAALRSVDRYQASEGSFRDALHADLRATTGWWEEEWRYHETWPTIRDCLDPEA